MAEDKWVKFAEKTGTNIGQSGVATTEAWANAQRGLGNLKDSCDKVCKVKEAGNRTDPTSLEQLEDVRTATDMLSGAYNDISGLVLAREKALSPRKAQAATASPSAAATPGLGTSSSPVSSGK